MEIDDLFQLNMQGNVLLSIDFRSPSSSLVIPPDPVGVLDFLLPSGFTGANITKPERLIRILTGAGNA